MSTEPEPSFDITYLERIINQPFYGNNYTILRLISNIWAKISTVLADKKLIHSFTFALQKIQDQAQNFKDDTFIDAQIKLLVNVVYLKLENINHIVDNKKAVEKNLGASVNNSADLTSLLHDRNTEIQIHKEVKKKLHDEILIKQTAIDTLKKTIESSDTALAQLNIRYTKITQELKTLTEQNDTITKQIKQLEQSTATLKDELAREKKYVEELTDKNIKHNSTIQELTQKLAEFISIQTDTYNNLSSIIADPAPAPAHDSSAPPPPARASSSSVPPRDSQHTNASANPGEKKYLKYKNKYINLKNQLSK